jgi:regulator of sirC expression with transglutaminase-like and TPR domain
MKTPSKSPSLPMCCTSKSFELLAKISESIDSPDALLQGAVAIAMHQMENVDLAKVDAEIQKHVDAIRARVRGHQPQALLAHMHAYLFEEQLFTGNTDNYYATTNSYLPAVLETRRGLPITLCLLYKIIGERLGLRVHGIGLPGHFLAGVEVDGTLMLIDPFAGGRVVTQEEAHTKLQEMFGPDVEWTGELLQPVTNRQWLTRMLQNLLRTFGAAGHYADVAAVLEMEMILWPAQDHLQRDLALVLARIGLSKPASVWLDNYLKNNPDDPQKPDLQQLLEVLST